MIGMARFICPKCRRYTFARLDEFTGIPTCIKCGIEMEMDIDYQVACLSLGTRKAIAKLMKKIKKVSK